MASARRRRRHVVRSPFDLHSICLSSIFSLSSICRDLRDLRDLRDSVISRGSGSSWYTAPRAAQRAAQRAWRERTPLARCAGAAPRLSAHRARPRLPLYRPPAQPAAQPHAGARPPEPICVRPVARTSCVSDAPPASRLISPELQRSNPQVAKVKRGAALALGLCAPSSRAPAAAAMVCAESGGGGEAQSVEGGGGGGRGGRRRRRRKERRRRRRAGSRLATGHVASHARPGGDWLADTRGRARWGRGMHMSA